MFKCFKMQITTGFKFSLPPLVKTKGKVGLPKSTELQLVFLGPGPSRHRLRKEVGLLMAPSQIDRASWAAGESKARAKRWASGKGWKKPGQEGCLGRGASVSFLSTVIWGSGEAQQRAASLVQVARLPHSGCVVRVGSVRMETTEGDIWRPVPSGGFFGRRCPVRIFLSLL